MSRGWRWFAFCLLCMLPALMLACSPLSGSDSPGTAGLPSETPGSTIEADSPQPGGKLIYGLTLSPSGIDPHINASSELGIPLSSVYDTLVFRVVDGGSGKDQYAPGLAEAWRISDDGLTYTFDLRRDVVFHDGEPFNAEAVGVNLERIVAPSNQSQKAVFLLGPFESVEVVDEYTVAIHLSAPYAPLLDGLAQVYLGMASPAALREWGRDYQFHQVGTGPFKFVEYVPNDHMTLVRNEDYRWAPSIYTHPGPAYLEEIEFRFFADPAGRALALEAGDVQVMGELPPLDAARLEKDPRFQIVPVAIPGQPLGLILNTQRAPLDDVRLRQALLLATDQQTIVQAVFAGASPPAYAPLTRATFGYAAALEGRYSYNPEEAAALLEEAGWSDVDGDGTRERNGQPLVLDALLMTWGSVPEVAQLLQAQWQRVGVGLRSQVVTYPAALEAAREGSYHVIPQSFSGSDPDLLWTYYHSGQPFNWTQVSDTALDDLLERGRRVSDARQRAEIYAQAQQRIMELALLVPIRDPVNLNAASARVQGLHFDSHGWFPLLHDVYLRETAGQ